MLNGLVMVVQILCTLNFKIFFNKRLVILKDNLEN